MLRRHEGRINTYGGSHGARDGAALDAAVHMPQSGMGDRYFHADLYEMAAAYLYHLVQGHPFIDGNKPLGAIAAEVFLALNSIELVPEEADFESLVLRTASGECNTDEITEFFRQHSQPLSEPG